MTDGVVNNNSLTLRLAVHVQEEVHQAQGPNGRPQVEIDVERGWPFRFKTISDRTTCCLRASWQVFLFLLLFVQEILGGVTARDVARQVRGWKVSFFFLECCCADHPEEAK